MAIYHLSAKVISRSSGRSAVAAAAYRCGERLLNQRDGQVHDFRARSGVQATFMAAPEDAPSWTLDRQALWTAVELHETRGNATTAREWEAALPAELDAGQREALSRQFAAAMVERFGIVADCAIHAPSAEGDRRNHHLHMLTTTRAVTAEGFGAKTRELDGGKGRGHAVDEVRALWADLCNHALEAAQVHERVDHRSHAALRVEAQEAVAAQEKAERSLNPIGKRQRLQSATEKAVEARERVQGLPDTPGTHKGPQRAAQERREAREVEERQRRAAEAALVHDRQALVHEAERQPMRAVPLSERVLGEAVKALRELREDGVRVFVRERLSQATEAAGRFMDRLLGLGLVQRIPFVSALDRAAADTYGVQVEAAMRDAPDLAASVAWAATASAHDRDIPLAAVGHWAEALPDEACRSIIQLEEILTPKGVWELRGGDALEAFKHIEATPREKLEWGRVYLEAEQAAGFDRKDALTALDLDAEVLALDEQAKAHEALHEAVEAAAHERRARGHDHGLEH